MDCFGPAEMKVYAIGMATVLCQLGMGSAEYSGNISLDVRISTTCHIFYVQRFKSHFVKYSKKDKLLEVRFEFYCYWNLTLCTLITRRDIIPLKLINVSMIRL